MSDIIAECKISRGGIYLYFRSVDEIFTEVIKAHNRTKHNGFRTEIGMGVDFIRLLDDYFQSQKKRLLETDKSLYRAVCEFFLSRKEEIDEDFFNAQFRVSRETIADILKIGSENGDIRPGSVDALTDTVLYVVEGLGAHALAGGVDEALVDNQFDFLKEIILRK